MIPEHFQCNLHSWICQLLRVRDGLIRPKYAVSGDDHDLISQAYELLPSDLPIAFNLNACFTSCLCAHRTLQASPLAVSPWSSQARSPPSFLPLLYQDCAHWALKRLFPPPPYHLPPHLVQIVMHAWLAFLGISGSAACTET
jgi:hypothetical protein